MWTTKYIISQVFVLVAMFFLGATYLLKQKQKILIMNVIATLCFSLEYAFLDEWSAVVTNLISMIGNLTFYLHDKYSIKKSYISLLLVQALLIIGGIRGYGEWYSFLPIISTVVFIYATWQKDVKTYRWLASATNFLWLIFNILCGAVFGTIVEAILFVISIVGLVWYYKENGTRRKNENN